MQLVLCLKFRAQHRYWSAKILAFVQISVEAISTMWVCKVNVANYLRLAWAVECIESNTAFEQLSYADVAVSSSSETRASSASLQTRNTAIRPDKMPADVSKIQTRVTADVKLPVARESASVQVLSTPTTTVRAPLVPTSSPEHKRSSSEEFSKATELKPSNISNQSVSQAETRSWQPQKSETSSSKPVPVAEVRRKKERPPPNFPRRNVWAGQQYFRYLLFHWAQQCLPLGSEFATFLCSSLLIFIKQDMVCCTNVLVSRSWCSAQVSLGMSIIVQWCRSVHGHFTTSFQRSQIRLILIVISANVKSRSLSSALSVSDFVQLFYPKIFQNCLQLHAEHHGAFCYIAEHVHTADDAWLRHKQ